MIPSRASRSPRWIIAMVLSACFGGGISALGFGTVSGCNYGVFGPPSNAGGTICRCTCGGISDPDAGASCLSTCQAPFDSAEKLARDRGCDAAFTAYTRCLEDNGTCKDHSFDAPACGSQLSSLTTCEVGGAGGSRP